MAPVLNLFVYFSVRVFVGWATTWQFLDGNVLLYLLSWNGLG